MPATASAPLVRSDLRSRLRGRAGRLAELVATPLVPADYLDLVDPLRSKADLRGRVVEVRPETRDAVTLVIRPGRGWKVHTPGQYVRIGVDVEGVRQWRAYSLTSPLGRPDGCIAVTVKAIPDGKVSNYLVRRAQPGLVLQLDQAAGEFSLPTPHPAKVLFVTAGSGITPVMGMLRNALNNPASSDDSAGSDPASSDPALSDPVPSDPAPSDRALKDVVLVHSAPADADVIFAGELRALASRGHIRLVERHTDTDGMLDVDELARLVPDLIERQTWACGPTAMLDALEQHFDSRGIADRLHTERFRPSVLVTGEGGTVSFSRAQVTVDADGATPILDAGEAAGVLMPSGCRMGICFGCVVPLRSGAVRDLRDGTVTTAAVGDGVVVQTCISAAAGACDIDL